jgi:signal transduction histidine kinase
VSERLRPGLLQVLGYAGAAVAVAAGAGAIADRRDEVGLHVALDVGIALVLLVVGWFVGDAAADVAWGRMRSVFWLGATLAWADLMMIGFGPDGADLEGRAFALAVSLAVTVVAASLWWTERRSLQLIALFVAAHGALVALTYAERSLFLVGDVPNPTPPAIATWLFGAAVIAAGAKGWLTPRRSAIVLGSLAAIGGSLLVEVSVLDGLATIGIVLSLLTAAVVVLVGERCELVAVTGVGIAGVLVGAIALVGTHVDELGAGLAVLVVGLAMLVATVLLVRRPAD